MSLPPLFAIRNVNVWNEEGVAPARDVVVSDGRISEILPTGGASLPETIFEGEGKALLPSGVDNQVHLRTPGQAHKETAETGLRAALRGGVGAVLTMPNTKPVIDSVETVQMARAQLAHAESITGVRALLSAAMTLGQDGLLPVNARSLKDAGVAALTDDGRGVAREDVMRLVFEANRETKLPLLQHAEVPAHGAALAAGPVQRKLGLRAYPAEAEWQMVERDLRLLREFPEQRYHVLHVSSYKTVELVAEAKRAGLHASCEVSPHHLLFTSDDIPDGNTHFKMNPPLRSSDDRARLREALADGRIDFVATDHAPHEPAAKGDDFTSSAFGTTGLEAFFRVILKLYQERVIRAERLVQVFSSAPARFLGIDGEFGHLKVGRPLRAILVDFEAPARPLAVEELESLSKNSCFLGAPLPGAIRAHFNQAGLFRF